MILITAILTSALVSLTTGYLISRYYERCLSKHQEAWLRQRQIIFFQIQRIEELEEEKARLHFQLLAHLSEPGQQLNAYRN